MEDVTPLIIISVEYSSMLDKGFYYLRVVALSPSCFLLFVVSNCRCMLRHKRFNRLHAHVFLCSCIK